MTKSILFPIALAAVLIIPGITLAAQYHYVDGNGRVQTIEATSAQAALAVAAQYNPHTGVALDMGVLEQGMYVDTVSVASVGGSGDGTGNRYQYVDSSGNLRTISAMNADQAIMMATDRDPNSGVIFIGS